MTDRLTDLLADFRDHAPAAFVPPTMPEAADRGRRRAVRRWLPGGVMAVAAAAVAMIALVSSPVPPAPEPPAPVADTITEVDWTDTEILLPSHKDTDECPVGKVRLHPRDNLYFGRIGQTRNSDSDDRTPLFGIMPGEMYGDLTGDGVPEAVLQIRCVGYRSDALMDQSGSQLLVVTMRSDHSLVGLGYVGVRHAEYPWYTVDDQKLFVQLKYDHSTPSSFGHSSDDTAFVQVYRWDGTAFQRIAGRAGNLNFRGQKDANGSRVRLASILRGDEVRCPAATVSFTFGEATENGVVYAQGRTIIEPVDLDGDHNDELIAGIGCRSLGYDAVSIYVFGQGETSFVPLDVPLANDGSFDVVEVGLDKSTLTLTLTARATGQTETRTLTWDGVRFTPGIGAFRLP